MNYKARNHKACLNFQDARATDAEVGRYYDLTERLETRNYFNSLSMSGSYHNGCPQSNFSIKMTTFGQIPPEDRDAIRRKVKDELPGLEKRFDDEKTKEKEKEKAKEERKKEEYRKRCEEEAKKGEEEAKKRKEERRARAKEKERKEFEERFKKEEKEKRYQEFKSMKMANSASAAEEIVNYVPFYPIVVATPIQK